jgi:hypothetical protein
MQHGYGNGLLTVLLGLSTGIVLYSKYYSVFSGEMDAGLGMCSSAPLVICMPAGNLQQQVSMLKV